MYGRLICVISFVLVLGLAGVGLADMVAYWPLDESIGGITPDKSGNGLDGTLVGGPTFVAGVYGQAIQLDGSNTQYVDCGTDPAFDITGQLTVAAWIKMDHVDDRQPIVNKEGDEIRGVGYRVESGGVVHVQLYKEQSQSEKTDLNSTVNLEPNRWYHVAYTYEFVGDGTSITVLYIDGQENTRTETTVGPLRTNTQIQEIGRYVWSASYQKFFNGLIDDVVIFNHVLSADEIQAVMNGIGAGFPFASNPNPADGAINPATWATLSWSPGDFAVSHDVYFGDNFDDVNDGTGGTFQGNQSEAHFFVGLGMPGDPYPNGLVKNTTYYWRIDEVNDADPNSPWKGNVWSFWIPPKKAYEPNPPDGSKFVDNNIILTWTAGFDMIAHNVYFGESFEDVEAGAGDTAKGQVANASYTPGPLEFDKTYYWRIDEFDRLTTYKGDVWSFTTTLPGLGTAVAERWENISGTDLDTLKDYEKYPNNPDVTEVITQFAWDGPDIDNYGGKIHSWLYAPATGDYTFWICTDDQGELWLSTDDDPSNIRLIASESDWAPVNSWGSGEEQSDPIPLVGGNKYYIKALWKEGTGGDHCQVAWQGPGVPTRTIIPGTNLSPYEPLKAYGAKPTNGTTGVTQTPVLQWKPGLQAASHEVYFGTDKDAVENATKTSPEYKGTRALGDESFNPGKLAWESTYYWRIDEVNNLNPDSPWIGGVWSFTTADFLILDDFEDYDAGENQIWYSWRDGLGYGTIGTEPYYAGNGTGSAVGDETTNSYTEEVIVHGGRQSMPYWYNNNLPDKMNYSEAKLTMGANARDWTDGGVKALSLWFQGYPASVGNFTEGPAGTYTMTASGYDIWFNADNVEADEFHFAYKTLTGIGKIVAKVESVQNTHGWAKAGVMIRETLDPNSAHAFACITPSYGVAAQGRPSAGGTSVNTNQTGITSPHWVRLERDIAGNFTVSHSSNGSTWEPVQNASALSIPMNTNVYIGLAVTAHNAAATCEAVFSNVTITGNAGQQWMHQDIGILNNDVEPMYVALANSTGPPAVVYHDNPNATQIDTWTEWNIDLKDFADQGVILTDVNSIAIGFGNRNNPQAGGSGKMYFDDIRLYPPRYIPGMGTPLSGDLNSDGVVDMIDVEVMAADWLASGPALAGDVNTDSTVDFEDYAVLADMWLQQQLWPEW